MLYMKVVKKVNPKSSHHNKKSSQKNLYLRGWMFTKLTVIIIS